MSSEKEIINLGIIFKEKRQELKMEISQVSAYLKVKQSDILAIEEERFADITRHLYVPGLLKSYAKFLHIEKRIVEEKISSLPIQDNIKNSKYKLLNLERDEAMSPNKDLFFNFLLIVILMFLILLSLYNFYEKNTNLISNNDLVKELVKIKF
jgi:cytoskeletal protein RodZ